MGALIYPFVQICLLRLKPQDLPSSARRCWVLVLAAHTVVGVAVASVNLRFGQAVAAGVVDTALLSGLTTALLIARTPARTHGPDPDRARRSRHRHRDPGLPGQSLATTARTTPTSSRRSSPSHCSPCSAGACSSPPTSFATRCRRRSTSAFWYRSRSTGFRSRSSAGSFRSASSAVRARPHSRHLRHVHGRARADCA